MPEAGTKTQQHYGLATDSQVWQCFVMDDVWRLGPSLDRATSLRSRFGKVKPPEEGSAMSM